MIKFILKITLLILLVSHFALTACSSSGGSSSTPDFDLSSTPNYSPSNSESLENLIINTFTSNGYDITVTPTSIDLNDNENEISKDESITQEFTLTNNSGEDQTFKFNFYSVSSGFSLLDENKINLGNWDEVTIANGDSKTFSIQFNAWLFGTQTTYLTISSHDTEGYIQLPARATVAGDADFRIIPTGYLCSDEDAPVVSSLDFLKVAYEQTKTHGIKFCNTGGEDIKIDSIEVVNSSSALLSEVFYTDVFEEFIWVVEDEIASAFALGLEPQYTDSFQEPTLLEFDGSIDDPAGDYHVQIYDNGDPVENIIIPAGELLRLNVNFSPSLNTEADEGYLYEPVSITAKMRIKTSEGTIDIPLVGASSGQEPVLKMSYRLDESETWREIDLTSNGSSLYFGEVDVFLDWVTDNFKSAEIKIENVGSGNKELEFYAKNLSGYFEYYSETNQTPTFPIRLQAGESDTFFIRYLPTPEEASDTAIWDFGQFYFEHSGGNGPQGKIALVGEQNSGYAVELKFGGSTLKREYSETESKNICVIQIDDGTSTATKQSFTVINNNKEYDLTVDWSVSADSDNETSFSASPGSGSLTVKAGSSETFSVDLFADSSAEDGSSIKALLNVETHYPSSVESTYSSLLSESDRNFTVPLQAQASSTGECTLGGGQVIGKDSEGLIHATMIVDRITMILTSLIEPTRNHPAFKFHFPLEIDYQNNRVRVAEESPFVWDQNDENFNPIRQLRAYAHQITSTAGCAPLPSNPYRLEYQKGSWTGDGFDCNGNGEITFTTSEGTQTLNTDTACMPNNGGEEYVDANGTRWIVFYHDFVKFNTSSCEMEYYGRIATFAYRPDVEEFSDVFKEASDNPNESETYYEGLYGAYQHDSYIVFNKDNFKCGSKTYNKGDQETDPDFLKDCYSNLAEKDDGTRKYGFVNECSYFSFSIDEGEVPDDAFSENPNTDSWSGYGTYEPHVDAEGNIHETKYDAVLYNVHAEAYAIVAGDRFSFFRHPGKLLYSELNVTFTTKVVADEADTSNWKDLIAVKSRSNFEKNQIFLKDGDPYDVDQFWVNDGINNHFSNVLDETGLEPGVNYGGYGMGNFRKCQDSSVCDIIPSGLPVNFDENNLMLLVGLGSFNGKGNTAPGFAKEDSSGKGKALYFTLHGCLVEGEPGEDQGCFSYHMDDAKMTEDDDSSNDDVDVVEIYKNYDILPDGYPGDIVGTSSSDCVNYANLEENNPDSENYDPYKYMACINYKIFPQDRDRLTNYYDSSKFYYQDSVYGSSSCGYGM